MQMKEIAECMANGSTTYVDREEATGEIPWNPHPNFKGVYLKHVIRSTDTEGRLSCHMVRIEPNAMLDDHVHATQWDLHEVIEGEGALVLESKETQYFPGRMAVIPEGTKHKVTAGERGLVLLAKFVPALL